MFFKKQDHWCPCAPNRHSEDTDNLIFVEYISPKVQEKTDREKSIWTSGHAYKSRTEDYSTSEMIMIHETNCLCWYSQR
jgi:hypothetical protein